MLIRNIVEFLSMIYEPGQLMLFKLGYLVFMGRRV
jgi:hypothetical protein